MAAYLDKTLCVVAAVIGLNIFIAIGTYFTSINEKLKYRLLVAQWLLHFQSGLFFIARYAWIKICPPLFRSPSVLERFVVFIVATVLVLSQCSVFTGIILAGEEPSFFTILSYICFGITILVSTTTFVIDAVLWCLSWTKLASLSHLNRLSRTRSKIILILIFSCILSLYGVNNASRKPNINHLEIPIKNLPSEFKGFRIVQVSDVHVGSTVGRTKLEDLVKLCNGLSPDAVVITGDLVDSTVYQIRQAMKPLLKIKAKHGLYFVTGNHEYYTGDVDGWIKELSFLGVTVLHNSHVTISSPGKPSAMLAIAGVDDIEGGIFRYGEHGMQINKALSGLKPHTATVLLAHQPKSAQIALKDYPSIGLVLSGHTHAGQMFPLHLYHLILQPYFSGLYRHEKGSYVYVNSGSLYWGIPMRILSSSEITHITLTTT